MPYQEYNGYTNFPTWKVQLEIMDGSYNYHIDFFVGKMKDAGIQNRRAYEKWKATDPDFNSDLQKKTADLITSYVYYSVTEGKEHADNQTAVSFAFAFLADVNYYELADHLIDYMVDNDSVWEMVEHGVAS